MAWSGGGENKGVAGGAVTDKKLSTKCKVWTFFGFRCEQNNCKKPLLRKSGKFDHVLGVKKY